MSVGTGYELTKIILQSRSDLSPTEKLVLLTLVSHCSTNWDSWPSQGRVAKATGYSVSTVNRAIKSLEARRIIRISKYTRQDNPQKKNKYHMLETQVLDAFKAIKTCRKSNQGLPEEHLNKSKNKSKNKAESIPQDKINMDALEENFSMNDKKTLKHVKADEYLANSKSKSKSKVTLEDKALDILIKVRGSSKKLPYEKISNLWKEMILSSQYAPAELGEMYQAPSLGIIKKLQVFRTELVDQGLGGEEQLAEILHYVVNNWKAFLGFVKTRSSLPSAGDTPILWVILQHRALALEFTLSGTAPSEDFSASEFAGNAKASKYSGTAEPQ